MKRALVLFATLVILTVSAAAAPAPDRFSDRDWSSFSPSKILSKIKKAVRSLGDGLLPPRP